MTDAEEEAAVVRAFVVAGKRARMERFLANPQRRGEFARTLAHFRDFDPRWIVPIPAAQQTATAIERCLHDRGAGAMCLAISEDAALDGRRLPLRDALDRVVGRGMGTILSCVPGSLAYFEGEGPGVRFILLREVRDGVTG